MIGAADHIADHPAIQLDAPFRVVPGIAEPRAAVTANIVIRCEFRQRLGAHDDDAVACDIDEDMAARLGNIFGACSAEPFAGEDRLAVSTTLRL